MSKSEEGNQFDCPFCPWEHPVFYDAVGRHLVKSHPEEVLNDRQRDTGSSQSASYNEPTEGDDAH